jgi:hypothetical protein
MSLLWCLVLSMEMNEIKSLTGYFCAACFLMCSMNFLVKLLQDLVVDCVIVRER